MAATTISRQQAALDKAYGLRLWERVEGYDAHTYSVDSTSTSGLQHWVAVQADGALRCDCTAAELGQACCHAAAVWIVRRHAQGWRITLRQPTPARTADPITRRTSGRGIGISPADLGDDDDLPTLAEQLAALGHKAAA